MNLLYFCDTNLMWRRIDVTNNDHPVIKSRMDNLLSDGSKCFINSQNLIEFQSVATRPLASNGLNYLPFKANEVAAQIEAYFFMLEDCPEIYSNWRWLMEKYDVRGRPVHDARLVAVMLTYGITHMLTRNGADFRRYHEITVVEV